VDIYTMLLLPLSRGALRRDPACPHAV